MLGGHASTGEMHRAPRVGAGDDVGRDPVDGGDLSISDVAGEIRMDHGVGPACTAAQPIVVEFDQTVHEGFEDGPGGVVNSLDVSKVAGVLHRNTGGERCDGWKVVESGGQPFVDVEDAPGEGFGFGVASRWPYSFMAAPASGGVDEDRTVVVRQCGDGLFGPLARTVAKSRMAVECATARGEVGGWGYP